jgi:tight adherence protein B
VSPVAAGALTTVLVGAVLGTALDAHGRRAAPAARRRLTDLAPAGGASGRRPNRRVAVPASLGRLADDLAPTGSADALVHRWLVAVVVGPAAALLIGGPGLAVPAAVVLVAGPVVAARVRRARRPARADRLLPGFLDAVARSVRSGASLRHALLDAADAVAGTALAPEAAALARALGDGVPLADALAAFGGPGPSPVRRLTVDALGLADEVGGAPAVLVDRVADTARERAAVAREARALAAQARASAVVIVVAPAAFAVLGAAADPRIAAFVTTPAGVACVAAGLACDAVGAWWMSRLVGRSA